MNGFKDVMGSALERVGLARKVEEDEPAPVQDVARQDTGSYAVPEEFQQADVRPVEQSTAMTLPEIYAAAGVPPSPYPAEKLLRLTAGLKSMDEGAVLSTINAIIAADGTWTLQDPIADATAKVEAIETHRRELTVGLTAAEAATQAELTARRETQEAALADIRRQIADMEGLLSRAVAKGEREVASINAAMTDKKTAAMAEMTALGKASVELSTLVTKFNVQRTI